MPFFHLSLSVPHPPINHVPTLLWPLFGYVVEGTHSQPNTVQSTYHISSSCAFVSSFTRLQSVRPLQIRAHVRETSDVDKYCQPTFGAGSSEEQTISEEVHFDSFPNLAEIFSSMSHKESERRRKIGLANKGKVPWNRGRKHSAETRARIKHRTIEALKDPKVKRKMAECPRAHSDESKSRIRSSLRRVWGKRLNFPRVREKFYLCWAASIAIAAKKGGSNQVVLDWDSYDKLKEEIDRQKLQQVEDKQKAKEMAKVRAERAAQAKADKMAKLAQMEKEREVKTKVSGTTKRKTSRKSREEKVEFETAQELKLKEKLTKIHKKKSIYISKQGEWVNSQSPAWETLDMEFIKREKMRREISLADQIRAAKNRKAAAASLDYYCLKEHKHKGYG